MLDIVVSFNVTFLPMLVASSMKLYVVVTFGRHFYPKRLTKSTFVEGNSYISLWYIKIGIEMFSSIHIYETNRTSFVITKLPGQACNSEHATNI